MKKWLGSAAAAFLIFAAGFNWHTRNAYAGVACSVPFNLTNGTTADASQVMANYNALIACLANAAAAGANNDITSLLGLTTPLSPSQGGSTVFIGATPSASGNTLVIATTTPGGFAYTTGYTIVFLSNVTNSATATININAQGTVNLFKQTGSGPQALGGGELQSGQIVIATYDGTEFQIQTTVGLASLIATNQILTGGAVVTSHNLGSFSGAATLTVNCGQGPLQYFTDAGAMTIASPATDSSCLLQMLNSASAATPSFSGFTTNSNTGEVLTVASGSLFDISVWRIHGVSSYVIKALQ